MWFFGTGCKLYSERHFVREEHPSGCSKGQPEDFAVTGSFQKSRVINQIISEEMADHNNSNLALRQAIVCQSEMGAISR